MEKYKKFVHKWSWILLVLFLAVGFFYPVIGAIALVCMLAPVIMALFRGRMWCGNFCPRGSFNDIILSRFSFKRAVPNFLKTTWFKNLVLIVLMTSFIVQLVLAKKDAASIGLVFVRMIFITTLVTIILGVSFKPRSWCMICPMGTFSQYVSKIRSLNKRFKHVTFNVDKCVSCKLCSKSCPIDIEVLKYKDDGKVLDSNCLKCNVCVEKCPKKSIHIA